MEKNDMQQIPYIVYEGAEARSERVIKRLIVALIIVTAMLFINNIVWLNSWTAYDYESTDEVHILDSEGAGNANYIGQDGSIVNGESGSD